MTDAIILYYDLIDNENISHAMNALEGIEYIELTDEEWEIFRNFCEKHNMYGRLELITKKFIRDNNFVSVKHYITLASLYVKSKNNVKASEVIANYRSQCGNNVSDRWKMISILYEIHDFEECLSMVREGLMDQPDNFGYLAMECQTLWRLFRQREARKKHKEMRSHLEQNLDLWLWFAAIAKQIDEPKVAREAIAHSIKLMDSRLFHITRATIHLYNNSGFAKDCKRLVQNADPKNYDDLSELIYIFNSAREYGAIETATKFGDYIMENYPNNQATQSIRQLHISSDFLKRSLQHQVK